MTEQPIRFDDGAAYDRGMGAWSRLAGQVFMDWLAPSPGLRWLDVGCGGGAFTGLLIDTCAPAEAAGIDPSDAQLGFAREHFGPRGATFQQGDAMALPFEAGRFDAAVMALVIFFVPDPAKGVAEMARVVRPGGVVAAYAWDMEGGGFPFEPVQAEMRARGVEPPRPPSADASRPDELRRLWIEAGLTDIETREIIVRREFADFEDFWRSSTITGSIRPTLAGLTPDEVEAFKAGVSARVPADGMGRIGYESRANAIKGRVPAG
jgi:SAM-dependent methyltransferase